MHPSLQRLGAIYETKAKFARQHASSFRNEAEGQMHRASGQTDPDIRKAHERQAGFDREIANHFAANADYWARQAAQLREPLHV